MMTELSEFTSECGSGANRQYFDRLYAHRRAGRRPLIDNALLECVARFLFARAPGDKLLDVGCGQGYFARVASRYFEAYALDSSSFAIRAFVEPGMKRWVGSAEQIAVRENTFDAVACIDTLEHVANPFQSIRECYRILKPGGIFLFRTPNLRSIGRRLKEANWFGFRDDTHISLYDYERWRVWTQGAGFLIMEAGTDYLSDVPYLTQRPNGVEKVAFQGISLALSVVKPYQLWLKGENLCFYAKKPLVGRPSGSRRDGGKTTNHLSKDP